MNSPLRTLEEIENELQIQLAQLTGMEAKLLDMHATEWNMRCEVAHLELQRERLKATGSVS